MKVYGITSPNQQINTRGKVIVPEHFTKAEKDMIDKVIKTKLYGKINAKILRKKPYDMWVERSTKRENVLEFWSSFKEIYKKEPKKCYITSIKTGDEYLNGNIMGLRRGIEWFDCFKKDQYGYNTLGERIIAHIRAFWSF